MGKTRSQKVISFMLFTILLFSSGCASIGVQVWDRDLLAEESMKFDSTPIQTALEEHIYFSKEASSGGRGLGGGGCGCN
ncbi:MAG: DUF4266 domain-containing protein [Nitrospinota bacterium]|nr:DUF4266 domain-containing protein [Nitrospinota bacterium]